MVQLTPFSRREVAYRFVPYVRADWVGPVNVVVRDRYFMKVLRVIGDEARGIRSEKEGLMLWVPAEDDDVGQVQEANAGHGVEERQSENDEVESS